MTGAISHKLRSQRGASMLLALLFLLICSMVTASILMAAVSNAGKHRSNLEEHQIYLALSSAVSTLCDELNRFEYRGQYRYWETKDEETGEIAKHFQQEKGQYGGTFKNLLLGNFDDLFREQINQKLEDTGVTIEPASSEVVYDREFTHPLTITPQTGTPLDDRPVTVTLEVESKEKTYAIYLTARLDNYQIRAELTPNANKPSWTSLMPSDSVQQTHAMKWRLGWITPGPKEEGDAAGT